jgi:hypothetical protein
MKVRSLTTTAALFALALVVLTGDAWATTRKITFKNKTGQAANDLHVEFVQASTPSPAGGPFGAFPNENGGGTTKVDFSGGAVPNNGQTSITFTSTSSRIKVKDWWWTWNGVQIGALQHEKTLAMVNFNQDFLRMGEMATVDVFAMADFGLDASLSVTYTIITPSGVTLNLAVNLVVPAGQELNQQLVAGAVSEFGTYTVIYKTVDQATGEIVTEGSSTVVVDSGVRPRQDI